MKREKMYFEDENADMCYPLGYFVTAVTAGATAMMLIDWGEHEGPQWTPVGDGSKITLVEALPDREQRACMNFPHVWIEKEDSPCGRQCELYRPRNGRSGACRSLTHGYVKGEKVTFRLEAGEWKEMK